MYYWNVALSEHCEEVPLECGSVHWNTEEVCEVAALHTVPLLGRRGSAVPARARATKSSYSTDSEAAACCRISAERVALPHVQCTGMNGLCISFCLAFYAIISRGFFL